MSFCKNCGTKVNHEGKYCSNCGTEVTQQSPKEPKKPSFQFSKKTKVFTGVIAGIIILLGAGYFVGASLTGKDVTVKNFEEALANQDQEMFMKAVSSSDSEWEIKEKEVDSFFKYLDKNPEVKKEIIENISKQAKQADSDESKGATAVSGGEEVSFDKLFTLKKDGNQWLVFDDYTFEVTPFYMNVSTNYEDTKIIVNGKEVAVSDSSNQTEKLGPFLPGVYSVKGVWKGDYAQLKKKIEIQLGEATENVRDVTLSLEGEMIHPESNYEDASLFVNGKSTGMKVGEVDELGPFPAEGDDTLHVEKKFPWGTVKSEKKSVSEGSYLDLTIDPFTDEMQEKVIKTVNSYTKSRVKAYKQADASPLKQVVTKRFLDEKKKDIQEMKGSGQRFKGKALKNKIDMDSFNTGKNDQGQFTVEVNMQMYFDSTYYNKGKKKDAKTEKNKNLVSCELVYNKDKQQWSVDKVESMFIYMAGEMKTFKLN